MIQDELIYIAPELAVLVTALVVILLDLFVREKKALVAVSLIGLLISAGFAVNNWNVPDIFDIFYGMLAVDRFALFFKILLIVAAGLVILASQDYISKFARLKTDHP